MQGTFVGVGSPLLSRGAANFIQFDKYATSLLRSSITSSLSLATTQREAHNSEDTAIIGDTISQIMNESSAPDGYGRQLHGQGLPGSAVMKLA